MLIVALAVALFFCLAGFLPGAQISRTILPGLRRKVNRSGTAVIGWVRWTNWFGEAV